MKVKDMLPSPDSARAVCGDALSILPEDEQEFLKAEAEVLIDAYDAGHTDMPGLFKSRLLDMEETLAIWFLLPSYVRSAIKKREGR